MNRNHYVGKESTFLLPKWELIFLIFTSLFLAVLGLCCCAQSSLVVPAGYSLLRCAGFSLRSTGSTCAGSVAGAPGLSSPVARGIFPSQGLNQSPLHWEVDS